VARWFSRLYSTQYPKEVVDMAIVDHALRLKCPPALRPRLLPGALVRRLTRTPRPPPLARNAGFKKLPARDNGVSPVANSLPSFQKVIVGTRDRTECSSPPEAVSTSKTSPGKKPLIRDNITLNDLLKYSAAAIRRPRASP
jgi:hypothetical protein